MGKVLAADWQLPLWMDSIGTGMSACLLGPFFGALCGATNNILYGMRNVTSYAYAVTSVAIASPHRLQSLWESVCADI